MLKYLILILAGLAVACTAPAAPASSGAEALTLTSPAFSQGEAIPQQFTCQGDNVSPELAWTEPPAGTRSLALLMEDPDAPLGTWVHWVVYNLPADARGLPQNVSADELPSGSLQGKTSFGRPGYGGPCPPSGQHHYYFRLYALDTQLDGQELDKPALLKAMEGHILAQGELMGVYQKP